jgi:hypothetical protein
VPERTELRRLSFGVSRRGVARRALESRPELSILCALSAGLFAFGLGSAPLAAIGILVAVAGLAWGRIDLFRAGRLSSALRRALRAERGTDAVFNDVTSLLAYTSPLRWAGLVSWHEAGLDGSLAIEWGSRAEAPTETALTSWLVRETESASSLVVAADRELGRPGACAALPLRRGDSITGFFVLGFARTVPRHVEVALRRCAGDLADALAKPGEAPPFRERLAAVS